MDDAARTYTLADLETWSRPGVSLAVLGHPIKHSISPAMHNAALAELARGAGRFADWRYFRFDVPPDELPRALELLHEKNFRGVNLTVPHKVLALSSPRVVAVDPAARAAGAINTLRRRDDGWEGFNTDGHGLAAGLEEDLGIPLSGAHVVLLGAGGAARGAATECLQRRVASLWIANRTRENLDALRAQLAPIAGPVPVRGFDPARPPAELPASALVVNATSAGLKAEDPLPIDLAALPTPRAVYDMIYNPAETALLAVARGRGIPAANGISMLVHQGARALELWTGGPVPVAAMDQAARAAMGRSR